MATLSRLSEAERHNLTQSTLGQAKCQQWYDEREGCITASKFAQVIKCKKPDSRVKNILYPNRNAYSDALRYGHYNEENAVAAYKTLKHLHECNVIVTETGLHVHPEFSFLGASPDRIVTERGDEGLLEVKCPFSKQQMTPVDACTDKRFCDQLLNTEVLLKKDNAYYQVQGQMGVRGHKWCDFVIWTNNGHAAQSTTVERIYFDEDFWNNKVLPGLLYFRRHALVPELLSRRLKRFGMLYLHCSYVPYIKYERMKKAQSKEESKERA